MPLFVTSYNVVGSRCNGTFLVNAPTKKIANAIVRSYDTDYRNVKSHTREEAEELFSMEWDDIVNDVYIPEECNATHLESGT